MGPSKLSLADIPAAEIELAGFNGRPAKGCGYSLPIIRYKATGHFALVNRSDTPLRWDDHEKINEFSAQGRLTLLTKPLAVTNQSTTGHLEPEDRFVVGWVDASFLSLIGSKSYAHMAMTGQAIDITNEHAEVSDVPTIWVWLGLETEVRSTFDSWARRLERKFDADLQTGKPQFNLLEQAAHFGLCAARDSALRYRLFARLCAALYLNPNGPPERARNVFRILVHTEFPSINWDRFRDDMMFVLNRSRDSIVFRQSRLVRPSREPKQKPQFTNIRLAKMA